MKCPKCASEMIAGKIYIGGGATTFLYGGGISSGNLAFHAANGREFVIQETSDVRPAHYCNHCGAVVIETAQSGLSPQV